VVGMVDHEDPLTPFGIRAAEQMDKEYRRHG
jgi:hypothetical protein